MHDRSDLGSNKGLKHFCLDVIIIRFLFLISLVSQSALFLIHFFTFIVSFIIGSQPICSLFVSLVYNCVLITLHWLLRYKVVSTQFQSV